MLDGEATIRCPVCGDHVAAIPLSDPSALGKKYDFIHSDPSALCEKVSEIIQVRCAIVAVNGVRCAAAQ
jgi:hypothetical protein